MKSWNPNPLLVFLFFVGLPISLTFAESEVNENPVVFKASVEPNTVNPGTSASLKVVVEVAPHHMAYRDKFEVKWVEPKMGFIKSFDISPTHFKEDKFSKKKREVVTDTAVISAPFDVPADIKPGDFHGVINVSYQACSADYCLFPKTVEVPIQLKVVLTDLGPQTGNTTNKQPKSTSGIEVFSLGKFVKAAIGQLADLASYVTSKLENAITQKDYTIAFLLVFLGGILSSLTPCILPMIPITIAIIGAKKATSRGQAFILSVSYVLGIATTYSTLGLIFSYLGILFGSFMGNSYFIFGLFFFFMAMALSMFGFFELQAPPFIRNRLATMNTGSGNIGAYVSGLFAGILAGPCTGPVLAVILGIAAKAHSPALGFSLLFVYSLGLGVLFMVLGLTFGSASKFLKPGPWMNATKFIFGFVFVGISFYFVKPILAADQFNALFGLFVVVGGSFIGAFSPGPPTLGQQLKKGLLKGAIAFAALVFIGPMALRVGGFASGPSKAELNFENMKGLKFSTYTDAAIEAARKARKPVIIDFYADWCAACKELEHYTFTDPQVLELEQSFVLLRVDATNSTPEVVSIQKQYGVLGLPAVFFIDAKGNVLKNLAVTGMVSGESFRENMNKALFSN